MTEIEKKAEENWDKCILKDINEPAHWAIHEHHVQAYKDGYEQGQKDFDTSVSKLLNSYGVTFIDTNSIGGLIALHQLILDLEKEKDLLMTRNLDLVNQIEKMKCCWNCANHSFYIPEVDRLIKGKDDTKCYKCKRSLHKGKDDNWELAK